MLTTIERPAEVQAPAQPPAYLCAWTAVDGMGESFPLGEVIATTPRLALRWTYDRARAIAPQLQAPAGWLMNGWSRDEAEAERALTHLRAGIEYRQTFVEEATRYELVVCALPQGGAPR